MSVYFGLWRIAEQLRIRDEYLLGSEEDEERRKVLKQHVIAMTNESSECKKRHINSVPPRQRDREHQRLYREEVKIRTAAIEEAKEILLQNGREEN